MQQVGTKIQMLRKHKNITQAQLAEALSVSPQSVSKWENQQSLPDISLLPVIARYFGITMDELFGYRLDALNYKERFIRFMADNGVLQFGAFPLQSGRISPYYINTGNYQSASQIAKLGAFYAECIREHNVDGNLLVGNTRQEIPVMIAISMARGIWIPAATAAQIILLITERINVLSLNSRAKLPNSLNSGVVIPFHFSKLTTAT